MCLPLYIKKNALQYIENINKNIFDNFLIATLRHTRTLLFKKIAKSRTRTRIRTCASQPKGPNPTLSLSLSLLKLPRYTNNENFLDLLHKFVCLYSFYCLFAFINICGGDGHDTVCYETMAMRQWVSLFEEFFLGLNRLCSSLFFIFLCGFDGG